MPSFTTTVLYPDTPGKKFDIDYYLNKHLPFAEEKWGPLGMKDWSVVAFTPGPDGSLPPYRLKTVSRWTSREAIQHATTSAEGQVVLYDAPNFTDEVPVLLVGEDSGSSSSHGQ